MLSIPDGIWESMLDSFAVTSVGLERVAYLDGYRWRDARREIHGVVTTLTMPDADLTPYNYKVVGMAIDRAGAHLSEYKMIRLAQVHTHGDNNTRHSSTDDAKAYSQLDGALSIVLARHAVSRPQPEDAAIHLRGLDGWTLLDKSEVRKRIQLVPSLLDQRIRFVQPKPSAKEQRLKRIPWI